MRLIQGAVATALVASGLLAGSAAAAPRVVAPGHSGTSQYTETLPAAGGETPTEPSGHERAAVAPGGGGGRSDGGAGAVPGAPTATESAGTAAVLGAGNAKRLEKAGPAGRATARLAATAGATLEVGRSSSPGELGAGGSSPVRQVVSQLTGTSGSDGVGVLLPILIAMSALVALAFVVVRRRGAHPGN